MFGFAQPRSLESPRIPRRFLNKLRLFERQPELATKGKYTITSDVDPEVVDLFFARVMGDTAEVVTAENAEQLRALCDELGFSGFDDEIRAVSGSSMKVRRDFMGLRGRVDRHDVVIEELQRRVLELERQLREQRRVPETVADVGEICRKAIAEVRREASDLREEVQRLRSEVSDRPSVADMRALAEEVARLKDAEATRGPQNSAAGKVLATPPMQQGQVARNVGGEFVYNEARPLDGIIAHLTREFGGNVHLKKVVEVTASSVGGNGWAKNAVELGTDSRFFTEVKPNQWICYDFKERRVAPTSYSIAVGNTRNIPRSWVFEVSNNGSEGSWVAVDHRDENEDLKTGSITCNFAITPPLHESFRFVRLRLTGRNHYGIDQLVLTSLELFGTLSSQ